MQYTSKEFESRTVIASDSDTNFLEDETGRVPMVPSVGAPYAQFPYASLVTGVVMAVKGVVMADGSLQVHDYAFAKPGVPLNLSSSSSSSSASPRGAVLLVSDLNYGCEWSLLPHD
jgi:hypothetical protein